MYRLERLLEIRVSRLLRFSVPEIQDYRVILDY